jgi:hypothetical protein
VSTGEAEVSCDVIEQQSRPIQPTLLFDRRLYELLGELVIYHNGLLVMKSNGGPSPDGSSSME